MALSLIGAGANIGGIFGGGGARAPRMNCEQKQLLQSQANLNNALAGRIRNGGNQCCQAQQGCFGNQRPGHCGGPICQQGMNGCGNGQMGPFQQIMGGFGQLFDRMNGFGGGGFGGGGFGGGFGGGCGFGGGGGWGGGFPGGGCFGNQCGINLNFNF